MVLKIVLELILKVIWMVFDIFFVRGLGSSLSVIVVGIELVNWLVYLNLFFKEKVCLVIEMEGYLDNVVLVILGDFVVVSYVEN